MQFLMLIFSLFIAAATESSAQISCLTGFITDGAGNPVENADLDFFDPLTGAKLVTPGDNSDASGFYNVCVFAGVYDVAFAPPAGTHLLGIRFNDVNLTTALELNVVLGSGVVIQGRIIDTLGLPVGNVDLDADRLTGGRAYTPNDESDPITGNYWIVVPPDEYRIRFEPPPGSRLIGLQIDSVSVLSDITLDITLLPGVLLTGRITDGSGAGIPDIDVDLRDAASGTKVFVANNTADAAGNYSVAVAEATYDLRFAPPRGSRYLGVLIDSLQITADRVWDQTLQPGLLVSAVVVDSAGSPVDDVDLDFKSLTTGKKIFTPNDDTDQFGTATVAVPPDLYKIQLDPPLNSGLGPVVIDSVSISGDTMFTITLPSVQRILFSGRVTDTSGVGIDGAEIRLRNPGTGKSVNLSGNGTDAQGNFQMAVPVGLYEVLVAPPASTRFVGKRIANVQFTNDSLTPDIVLNEGLLITLDVRDDLGIPAVGTDIDFVSEVSGIEVFTPKDNVDSLGVVTIPVLPDVYTVIVDPPASSGLLPLTITGVLVSADTTLSVTLRPASGRPDGPFFLSPNYPNPFNGVTRIPFTVLQPGNIQIDIFNLLGQHVKRLESNTYDIGVYVAMWDGTNAQNTVVTSGMYFYTIRSKNETRTRKLILLR